MKDLKTLVTEDRRLRILALLAESNAYTAPADVIRMVLDRMGHAISSDLLATELAWLAEQGLVTLQDIGGAAFARITVRGLDVASGAALVPGVARPRPE